ncbi:aldo/keto reductase [Geodermatophilus sp. TF02-6]|uniref:aldo/keto reductase n=1 Tax=Geodermatophilus sp. TF02-6 TaxID=2250575 RepID=UPI00272E7F15|nr:aldo/keto reductase [Geodermatophilus sp. TF02-6]
MLDQGRAHRASDTRYDSMTYRRTGRSGLDLPAISLGLGHNFGDDVPFERQRAVLRRAFDLGITHFDLANNYGFSVVVKLSRRRCRSSRVYGLHRR